jgi:ribosomal protein S21
MINVQVERTPNESTMNVLRRFTKKVQGSGVLPKVRSIRYATRTLSPYKIKQHTLKVLRRREEIAELIKLGKMSDKPSRYGNSSK